ncbi:hypothetical protein MKW92_014497 [Papaver armeniacum]|nr:hypothetical protein MKW92_014497 [Papaver armeniacum]
MKYVDLLDGDLGDEAINAADTENEVKIGDNENGLKSVGKKNDYEKVRETIRAFNRHYRYFVKKEKIRVRNIKNSSKNKLDCSHTSLLP